MRFAVFHIRWFLALLVLAAMGHALNPVSNDLAEPEHKLPEPLTEATFKNALASDLHIVEFFSPYCHHCKQLAPIWEKMYNNFYEEAKNLNIYFHQVNCVESGDLCDKEDIRFFPDVRLYGPEGYIKGFPKGVERTEASIISFAKKEALDADNLDISKLTSKSEFMDDNALLKLLSEQQTKPYLISFWPSSDFQDVDSTFPFEDCEDCALFQRIWKLVSNKAESVGIRTAHFNCVNPSDSAKNEVICDNMSMKSLSSKSSSVDRFPQVALILPDRKSGSFIRSTIPKSKLDSKSLTEFAVRTLHNSEVPSITRSEIEYFLQEPKIDPFSENLDEDKLLLVFNYDSGTVVPEDFQFLEQLIEPLAQMPNVYLYKNSQDLLSLSRDFFKKIYRVYNTEPPVDLNMDHFVSSSVTQLPTFFLFKKGSLMPVIFPGYSTTETRNLGLILDWLTVNSVPIVNELTRKTFQTFMEFEPKFYDRMVIQIVNRKTNKFETGSRKLVEGLASAAHTYDILRNEAIYDALKAARDRKKQAVESLKANNAATSEFVAAMREEIAYDYKHRVIFTYLDINDYPKLLKNKGLAANKRKYAIGDIIVVDKSRPVYYETDSEGKKISLTTLPQILAILIDPSKYPDYKLKRTFIVSPLSIFLRFFDWARQSNLSVLVLFVLALILLWKLPKVYHYYRLKKRYTSRRDTQGILGSKHDKEAKFID